MKLSGWCPEADRGAPSSSGVSRTGLAASHSLCCANVRCFLGEIGASPGRRREPHPPLLLQGSLLQGSLLQPKPSYLVLPLPPIFWATGVPSTHLPIAQTDSLLTTVRVCNERRGGSKWRGAPPPATLVGSSLSQPGRRRGPRGQAQRTGGEVLGREPLSSPPLLLASNPELLLTGSALIINDLTTLGQALQLKIKRKTGSIVF